MVKIKILKMFVLNSSHPPNLILALHGYTNVVLVYFRYTWVILEGRIPPVVVRVSAGGGVSEKTTPGPKGISRIWTTYLIRGVSCDIDHILIRRVSGSRLQSILTGQQPPLEPPVSFEFRDEGHGQPEKPEKWMLVSVEAALTEHDTRGVGQICSNLVC